MFLITSKVDCLDEGKVYDVYFTHTSSIAKGNTNNTKFNHNMLLTNNLFKRIQRIYGLCGNVDYFTLAIVLYISPLYLVKIGHLKVGQTSYLEE